MHSHEVPTNPLDAVPTSVWPELYQGRWERLRRVHKIEFVVEVIVFLVLFGAFGYGAYAGGRVVVFGLTFLGVGLLLGAFFWLLRRKIR